MAKPAVMVVEPDEPAAAQLKVMLDRLGFDVILADGETAVSVFNYVLPVAVLVAYPHGKRVTEDISKYVHRESAAPTTRVLAMVPAERRDLARRALVEGCFDTIPKPVGFDALRTILSNAIPAP